MSVQQRHRPRKLFTCWFDSVQKRVQARHRVMWHVARHLLHSDIGLRVMTLSSGMYGTPLSKINNVKCECSTNRQRVCEYVCVMVSHYSYKYYFFVAISLAQSNCVQVRGAPNKNRASMNMCYFWSECLKSTPIFVVDSDFFESIICNGFGQMCHPNLKRKNSPNRLVWKDIKKVSWPQVSNAMHIRFDALHFYEEIIKLLCRKSHKNKKKWTVLLFFIWYI